MTFLDSACRVSINPQMSPMNAEKNNRPQSKQIAARKNGPFRNLCQTMRSRDYLSAFLCVLCGLFSFCSSAARADRPSLPQSCQLDFRTTLEWPAGRHGFLTVGKDGHFTWEDGGRARFWGINVSSTRLKVPPEQIERVVQNFARAGINLVRLEAIDNRNCLLGGEDAPDSLHLDARYLDCLDRWIEALRRYGIYYYLDLLDFRTFKTGDGVLNADQLDRGARPYAVFDRFLIQLQKDYASRLLTRRNPYTGLRPVDDPALVMVEICNEHGFFLYPEKLDSLVDPYRADLRARWNRWLRDRYQTRERLAAAWTTASGVVALRPEEDPTNQTVDLPMLSRASDTVNDVRRIPNRLNDGVEFLVGVQRAYFKEMRDYLRSLGVRVPVTAVVSTEIVPDVAAAALECDFTSENWYGDGPTDDPKTGLHYYANRNPLRDDGAGGFAPYTAALRWGSKPVVVREWANPWPNQWRASSVPEALAYASLQDYDAVLLFGYQTNRAPNGAEADALNDYAFQSDPTVWGLYALAGQAFLHRAIRPAVRSITLTYPPSRLFTWPNGLTDLHRLAWSVRLNSEIVTNAPPKPAAPPPPPASSKQTTGKQTPQKNARRAAPNAGQKPEAGSGKARPNTQPPIPPQTPTGLPQDAQGLRTLLDQLNRQGAPFESRTLAAGIWRSDTGEIARYDQEGRLEIRTPTLRLLAGELKPNVVYDLGGGLRFSTPTPLGALLLFALDGQPIEKSRHLAVKMVSRAENTGQALDKAPGDAPNAWVLTAAGRAPVLTFGRAALIPTRLWHETPNPKSKVPNTKELLSLYMVDGSWEMEIRDDRVTLACDTPGMNGLAQGRFFTTSEKALEMTFASGKPGIKSVLAH
jgi:hypothetical protein